MIDFRLYRLAWIPAIAAFVVMMFSLEGVPEPPEPQIAPATFDGERAADVAREILATAPERTPGSAGDEATADLVLERFEEVEAGTTGTQAFEAEVGGSDEELRNVVLTLPGESSQTVVIIAARDSATGPGAASSAAATAALVELGEVLGGTEHTKTLVLVSTAAGTAGAEGARRFLEGFDGREQVEAAVVIAQPGAANPSRPHVLRHSTGDESTSMGLVRVAEAQIEELGRDPGGHGVFADLSRLAVPTAVGEQAALIAEGVDAIAISSAGEAPLPPDADAPDDLDAGVLGEFGSAALATILVTDALGEPLPHGPDRYVEFSGSLVPGWAIAAFALALLLPAAVAALDAVARAARRRAGIVRSLTWAFALALPPAGALLVVLIAGLAGVLADPAYPFDPRQLELGRSEALFLVALAAALVLGYALTGLRHLPRGVRPEAIAPALGAAAVAATLLVWILNPFLALLVVPAAHAWLVAGRRRSRALLIGATVLSVIPLLLAVRSSAGAVGAGPWDLVLMVVDGQLGPVALLGLCPLAGALVGQLILAAAPGAIWTNGRAAPLGSAPQPGWGPAGDGPATASIHSGPPGADVLTRREPGTGTEQPRP